MTHQPPVPAASTSPFPLHPEPIVPTLPPPPAPPKDNSVSTRVGLGVAMGIGSAAIVAALLYSRNSGSKPKTKAHDRGADRARVSAEQPYEVQYFARKHGLTAQEARDIIAEAGPSRAAANALAAKRKSA